MAYQQIHQITINNDNMEMQCYGYKRNSFKTFLFQALSILTVGIINLVTYWKPFWKVALTKDKRSLEDCDTIVLKDEDGDLFVEKVVSNQRPNSGSSSDLLVSIQCVENNFRYFQHKCTRFVWNNESFTFSPLIGLQPKCSVLLENYLGVSENEAINMKSVYGPNTIEVEVKSYLHLLVTEVLNPFYVFQILSIVLWCNDEYYYYAGCIFFVSCISVAVSLYETRKQSEMLHDMITSQSVPSVTVIRKGKSEPTDIFAEDLVPGDILVIPEHGTVLCCDAVLIAGNCIVNESMLTGESVPVTKTPIVAQNECELFCPEIHRRHTLYSGTAIVQTRYYGHNKVLAVVVRTGFNTAKGELVRSILFPKQIGFSFYQDSIKFIFVLFFIALIGMSYSIYIYIERNSSIKKILIRSLDIITIVVPPSLPAAMTVGTVYAQNRLKKKGIFCISPPRINVSGKLTVLCFDKTGTLTEDGLDFYGIICAEDQNFSSLLQDPSKLPRHNLMLAGMATCHSLTLLNKELTGDPLDIKMFESTKWILEEPGSDTTKYDCLMPSVVKPLLETFYLSDDKSQIPLEIGIVRQFTFSSSLQRMSVIVRKLGAEQMDVYVKGAPEKIQSLCCKDSIPDDFNDVLHKHSILGFRILAVAYKSFSPKVTWHQAQRLKRDVVESNLTLLGFILMQNALKPQSKSVINSLHKAKLRTVMVTGDNSLTAVSVARECSMISSTNKIIYLRAYPANDFLPSRMEWEIDGTSYDVEDLCQSSNAIHHLIDIDSVSNTYQVVVDGKSFGILRTDFKKIYEKLLVKGKVFARMAPDQKTQLMEDLQTLDYNVGMCGDGANDCGALKAAHVGVSLSEAEASVAAPFTSKIPNISCIPELIKEGRCALVTSFGVFKYMALYSMIQFISVLILYTEGAVLGDMMFLYVDLCITTTVAVLMGLTGPFPKIVKRRPQGSLVSFVTISSVFSQILLVVAVQLFGLYFLKMQNWYSENKVTSKDKLFTSEGTVIFCLSSYQYIILSVVFSKGPPYRQPLYKNIYFFVAVLILVSFSTILLFEPFPALTNFFQLRNFQNRHHNFVAYILCIAVAHLILSICLEAITSSTRFKRISSFLKKKKEPKHFYKRLEKQISNYESWLSQDVSSFSPSIS